MAQYLNAYLQVPIRRIDNHGIRIIIELMLKSCATGYVFRCGHRKSSKTHIGCRLANKFLLIEVISQSPKINIIHKIPLTSNITNTRILLEVSLYPNGILVVAINGKLTHIEKVLNSFEITNGKIIIGSDLSGNNFGTFYSDAIIIQSINKHNEVDDIFISAMRRIKTLQNNNIPPKLFYREIFFN